MGDSVPPQGPLKKLWRRKMAGLCKDYIADQGALEESDLYNLRKGSTTFNEVEELLRKLVAEKWLSPSVVRLPTRRFTLGPRVFLELITFFRDLQVNKFPICQYELLQGARCQRRNCETVAHQEYGSREILYRCPTCRNEFRQYSGYVAAHLPKKSG
ncbi:hypothetical protein PsorP6_003071 [Peronosclerospora sorghi]|uniref:Uncharacterized protein n=1 Tax=Peronosclerospora sorghi TaxID=230839 RepID=A0ACC0VPF6_9STRA|nr:hypothetical protein PsorP6_003071 [Peronosclerospora sorghi]